MIVEQTNTKTQSSETLLDTSCPFPDGLPDDASLAERYVFAKWVCEDLRKQIKKMPRSIERQTRMNRLDLELVEYNKLRRKYYEYTRRLIDDC